MKYVKLSCCIKRISYHTIQSYYIYYIRIWDWLWLYFNHTKFIISFFELLMSFLSGNGAHFYFFNLEPIVRWVLLNDKKIENWL
jgi:hypothetical protein